MQYQSSIIVYTDGGSRGNPGESSFGVVTYNEHKKLLFSIGKPIGITTNNVAEYSAIKYALEWCVEQKSILGDETKKIIFYMDSLLAVMQLTGKYKIKSPHLFLLFQSIKHMENAFPIPIEYHHIRREFNKEADSLVNKALDTKKVVKL